MEDIFALILVLVAIAVVGFAIYKFIKFIDYHQDEAARKEAELDMKFREMERKNIQRTLERERALRAATANKPPSRGPVTTYAPTPKSRVTSTASTVTPAPVNNWSDDLLTTMVIADMLSSHKDVSAGTVKWKDDTPTITETYSKPSPSSSSWGLDDSDSRKSASSSFSSSDSDSSWSSSSSDSGPSSDW